MPLEPAETRPRSNDFPESVSRFSKVQSAKLNTDETILMASTEYFGQPQFNYAITYISCVCGKALHVNVSTDKEQSTANSNSFKIAQKNRF